MFLAAGKRAFHVMMTINELTTNPTPMDEGSSEPVSMIHRTVRDKSRSMGFFSGVFKTGSPPSRDRLRERAFGTIISEKRGIIQIFGVIRGISVYNNFRAREAGR